MQTSAEMMPGSIVWAEVDPSRGREQSGRRPVLVVSSRDYLDTVQSLAVVVPVSSVDRGWPNHVELAGVGKASWAMTEQVRTVSRERLHGTLALASEGELREVRSWLSNFLGLEGLATSA